MLVRDTVWEEVGEDVCLFAGRRKNESEFCNQEKRKEEVAPLGNNKEAGILVGAFRW